MIKRLRWMLIGAAAGAAGFVWLSRKAKDAAPAKDAVAQARTTSRELGARLRDALRDGRAAFEDTRRDLSRELLPRDGGRS